MWDLSNVCYCQLGNTQSIDSPQNHHLNLFQNEPLAEFSHPNSTKIKSKPNKQHQIETRVNQTV
jgi:hypothetical protein